MNRWTREEDTGELHGATRARHSGFFQIWEVFSLWRRTQNRTGAFSLWKRCLCSPPNSPWRGFSEAVGGSPHAVVLWCVFNVAPDSSRLWLPDWTSRQIIRYRVCKVGGLTGGLVCKWIGEINVLHFKLWNKFTQSVWTGNALIKKLSCLKLSC